MVRAHGPGDPSTAFGGPPPRDKLGEDFRNGFTLIELMVVLFIIGGIVQPGFASFGQATNILRLAVFL